MNQQALEAAAKAAHYAINSVGPVWDCWPDSHKAVYYKLAIAALTAYVEACGERVVATNQTGQHVSVTIPELDARFWVFIGESIVLERKVGT